MMGPDDDWFDGDLFDDGWLDETQLDYCPACGSELTRPRPVKCPEHGEISIEFTDDPMGLDDLAEEDIGDEAIGEFIDMFDPGEPDRNDTGASASARDRINDFLGRG